MLSNFKKEYKIFSILFNIQVKYWFKNPLNIFLGVFISLYTVLCWLAFKTNDPFLMISGICVAIVRNSLYIYLRQILDWRNKTVFDKINMENLNSKTKHASLFIFNLVSTLFICLFLLSICLICFPSQFYNMIDSNHLMVVFGIVVCWITCYVIAMVIYFFVKHQKWATMIGLLIYFSTMYFLGLGFPFETIVNVKWLNILIYLHPFRYSINIVQAGFADAKDFYYVNESIQMHVDFGYGRISWLPYLLAIIVLSSYTGLLLWKIFIDNNYKFKSTNKIKILKSESKSYIKKINETNNIELLKVLREDRRKRD